MSDVRVIFIHQPRAGDTYDTSKATFIRNGWSILNVLFAKAEYAPADRYRRKPGLSLQRQHERFLQAAKESCDYVREEEVDLEAIHEAVRIGDFSKLVPADGNLILYDTSVRRWVAFATPNPKGNTS